MLAARRLASASSNFWCAICEALNSFLAVLPFFATTFLGSFASAASASCSACAAKRASSDAFCSA